MDAVPTLSSVAPAFKRTLALEETLPYQRCFDQKSPTRQEQTLSLHETSVLPGCKYFDNVLTPTECVKLIDAIDNSEDLSFWSEKGRENDEARAFRNADTIEVNSEDIGCEIWNRVRKHLQGDVIDIAEDDDGTDPRWAMELPGHWQASGINRDLLFVKYPSRGSFSPHTDGNAIETFNIRSFYSVIIFLNTVPRGKGAGTKFYSEAALKTLAIDASKDGNNQWTADQNTCIGEVEAVAGRMLMFDQKYVHEGVPPADSFSKYIIRTDVMFTRNPPLCDEPHDREAHRMYLEAERMAEKGDNDEAVALFRRAFKKSPALARIMGQA